MARSRPSPPSSLVLALGVTACTASMVCHAARPHMLKLGPRLLAIVCCALPLATGCSQQLADSDEPASTESAESQLNARGLATTQRASFQRVGSLQALENGLPLVHGTPSIEGLDVESDLVEYRDGNGVMPTRPRPGRSSRPGSFVVGAAALADAQGLLEWRNAAADGEASPKDLTFVLFGRSGLEAIRIELRGALPKTTDDASHVTFDYQGSDLQLVSADAGIQVQLSQEVRAPLALAEVPGALVTFVRMLDAPIDASDWFSMSASPFVPRRTMLGVNPAAADYFARWRSNPKVGISRSIRRARTRLAAFACCGATRWKPTPPRSISRLRPSTVASLAFEDARG